MTFIARLLPALLLTLSSALALAGDPQPIVDATEAQYELNEQAVQAAARGEHDQAILLFKASLELGELNITYLNLGRTHFESGDCLAAKESFERALLAPAIADPSPERVRSVVERQRRELDKSCPGTLVIQCEPVEVEVSIGTAPFAPCGDTARALEKGTHDVVGRYDGKETKIRVEIRPMETAEISFVFSVAAAPVGSATPLTPIIEPEPAARPIPNWVWLAAGGAALVAGGVLDFAPPSARNYTFDALDVVPIGLYGLGSGLVYYGARRTLDKSSPR